MLTALNMTVFAFHSECSFDTLGIVLSVGKVRALNSLVLSLLSCPSSCMRTQKAELYRTVSLLLLKRLFYFKYLCGGVL